MLLDTLRARQRALHLTEAAFAQSLGISRALWWMMTTGRMRLSERALRGVVTSYPDLEGEVLLYLRSADSKLSVTDSGQTDPVDIFLPDPDGAIRATEGWRAAPNGTAHDEAESLEVL